MLKVVVCLKHVPDPREPWRFEPQGHTLLRDHAEGLLNPLDDHALEAVLRWRDAGVDLECWALAMGPKSARDTLNRALAKGADRAAWVQDPALAGSDLLATGRVLAAAIRRMSDVTLVLTGDRSLDGACGALAPMLAERLGWPYLGGATRLEVPSEDEAIAERPGARTQQRVQCPLPAVISVGPLAQAPRLPSFAGIMATSRKELVTWTIEDLGLQPQEVGAAGSGTSVRALEAPVPRSAGPLVPAGPAAQAALIECLDGLGRRA